MALRLEVFENADSPARKDTVVLDTELLQEEKLTAYDSGYSAGWEDALAAQSEDQTRLRSELARNLQSLSFTYHEARSHVLEALEPLMEEVVGRLLPAIAREALGAVVLETLAPLVVELAETPLVLVLNPASRAAVESVVKAATSLPLRIEDEPSLSEGQVYLRFGNRETRINLDRAVTEIASAVRGYFAQPTKDKANG